MCVLRCKESGGGAHPHPERTVGRKRRGTKRRRRDGEERRGSAASVAPPPPALGQAWPAPGFSTRAMRAQWRGPGQRGPSVDLSQACGMRATACIGTLPPPLARGLGREVKRGRRNCSAGKRCQANLRQKGGGKQKREWGKGAEKCSPVGRWPPGNSLPRRGRGKIPGWIVGPRYVGAGSSVTRRAGNSTRVRGFAPVIFRGSGGGKEKGRGKKGKEKGVERFRPSWAFRGRGKISTRRDAGNSSGRELRGNGIAPYWPVGHIPEFRGSNPKALIPAGNQWPRGRVDIDPSYSRAQCKQVAGDPRVGRLWRLLTCFPPLGAREGWVGPHPWTRGCPLRNGPISTLGSPSGRPLRAARVAKKPQIDRSVGDK